MADVYAGGVKLYTRTGDAGTTGLIGGRRVGKDDPRIDAYGTVDELNAHLGLAAVACDGKIARLLSAAQHDLFAIGSHLAAPDGGATLPPLPDAGRLEAEIDSAEAELEPLSNFVLPGGTEAAARLHVARCACRRAERLCVALAPPVPGVVAYLNRLGDWLFAHARLANARADVADVPWRPGVAGGTAGKT